MNLDRSHDTLGTQAGTIRQLHGRQRLVLEVLSFSTLFLGAMVLLYFANRVRTDPGINEVLNWTATEASEGATERPSLVLAFLDSFGIIVPLLMITAGGLLIRLGVWLRQRDINAARWAQIVYIWLTIALGGVAILHVVINGIERAAVMNALLLGLAMLPCLGAAFWLNETADIIFLGEEPFAARETRSAWNLLIPTLAVLIIVAARPLEQTFINSLTDKRFASRNVPQFVGLDNYEKLLNVRFDEVGCRRDETTNACRRRDDGSIRWEIIDRSLLEQGYRTVWNLRPPLITDREHSIAVSGLDDDWLKSVWTTLQFVVVSVALELVIGLFIALVVNSGFRGRGFMRAVMLVPWAIPTVISARLWELILKDSSAGIVNRVLMDLSLLSRPEAWLSQPDLQIPSAIMVDVWKTSPFIALLLLAGLQTIPSDLYEAAAVDGANKLRQFLNITLPLLRPTIAVALVFRTLDALRVFDLFNVLFGRQQLTMATYNYETLVNTQQDGYASAIGVLIFFFIFIFALLYVRLLGVETE
jgi:trehalose/maltose transport system permease protein